MFRPVSKDDAILLARQRGGVLRNSKNVGMLTLCTDPTLEEKKTAQGEISESLNRRPLLARETDLESRAQKTESGNRTTNLGKPQKEKNDTSILRIPWEDGDPRRPLSTQVGGDDAAARRQNPEVRQSASCRKRKDRRIAAPPNPPPFPAAKKGANRLIRLIWETLRELQRGRQGSCQENSYDRLLKPGAGNPKRILPWPEKY